MNDMRMRWCTGGARLVVAAMVAGLTWAGSARAQTEAENKAAARELGIEGIQLAMDGNCAAALDKLTRAHQLYFAPTIAVWLGECQIQQGQLVAGTETLQRVVREPLTSNAPAAFRSSQMRAQTLLDETLPRLAKLTVNVESPAGAQYRVTIDGNALPGAMIGVARPIDPGEHQVGGTGEGLTPVTETIALPEGGSDVLTLTLIPAETGAEPSAPVVTETPTTPVESGADQGSEAGGWGNQGLKVGGYTALAVGGLGIIAGSAFGVSATNKRGDLDGVCEERACPPSARNDIDAMKSAATVSTIGFVVGGVGVAAGVGMLALAGRTRHEPPVARVERRRLRVTPVVGLGSFTIEGSF